MAIQVNNKGLSFAHSLIRNGKIDFSSDWRFSATDGNKLLGAEGNDWTNYAKYHLAEDTSQPEETQARYKYLVDRGSPILTE